MDKLVEPFTSRIGEKITTALDFNNNKQALDRNLEVLTSKAFDIETEVKEAELSGKKRRKIEVGNWLEKVKKFKKEYDTLHAELELEQVGVYKRLRTGNHVKDLKDGVEQLLKQSETFRELVIDACETSRERLFSTQLHGEASKQELDNILAWVEVKSDQVRIIGIYGMGGVGKTTLANQIHKHICTNLQDTSDKFHVYWVTVSQEVDINKLQNDLAKKLNSDLSKDHDIEEKAATLQKALRERKNVVLILDDVLKYFDLEKIGVPLGIMDGCKIIITSRLRDVCNQMGCKETIKVQPLSDEEAWKLFLAKLDCGDKLTPEVEKISKKIAKKCNGLPLAIITVARSMIRVYDIHIWRNSLEELKRSMRNRYMENEVLPILLHSYNRLTNQRLQQCFLYCSLLPEDYEIPRDELMRRFIFEGMMHQRDNMIAEIDQGYAILDELVNVCLLESVLDFRGKECVKMHDLLREMAVEITRKNPKFTRKVGFQFHELLDEQEWAEDLDKASLMHNNIVEIPEGMSPICPRLSTLILSYTSKLIPDSFFAHMHGLRVLNLSFNHNMETLPNSISELENLTALLLGGCRHLCYVLSLRKLKELRELDLSETGIKQVPEGMECLVKLKCLNMHGTDKLEEIPRGLLPRLRRLQRLLLPLHIKVESKEVESLKLLEEFEGWIDDVDIFYSKWFNKSPPITFYKIVAGNFNFDYNFSGDDKHHIVLKGWSFKRGGGDVVSLPRNIQRLQFIKCKGLSSCLLEDVPSLYYSKDLQKCVISWCDEIECIMRISSASNGDGPLQNLEDLSLRDLPNLIGLIKWEPRALAALPPPCGTFFSLKKFNIFRCHKMKKLFPHKLVVHNLQNLEMIWVSDCDQMEEIIADDEEDECVGLISHSNNTAFPKLKSITVHRMPKLDSICKGEIICCDSIEYIHIGKCPKLKRLPLFHPSPSASSSSPSSSSRSNGNNQYTNITTFPKLRWIWLYSLPELESIYEGTINCCNSIENICIVNCPKIKRLHFFNPSSVDEKSTIPFPKLEQLDIWNLPQVKRHLQRNHDL